MLVDGRDDEAQRVDGDAGDGRRRLGRTGNVVRPGQRHERAIADADGHHHGSASDERNGAPAIDGDVLPEDHRLTPRTTAMHVMTASDANASVDT